jgi:hypothetical protein
MDPPEHSMDKQRKAREEERADERSTARDEKKEEVSVARVQLGYPLKHLFALSEIVILIPVLTFRDSFLDCIIRTTTL